MSKIHDRIRFLYAQPAPDGTDWNKMRLAAASGIERRRLTLILEEDIDLRVEGDLRGLAHAFGIEMSTFFVVAPDFMGSAEEQHMLQQALKNEDMRQLVLVTAQMPPAQRRTVFELLRSRAGIKILQGAMAFVTQLEENERSIQDGID